MASKDLSFGDSIYFTETTCHVEYSLIVAIKKLNYTNNDKVWIDSDPTKTIIGKLQAGKDYALCFRSHTYGRISMLIRRVYIAAPPTSVLPLNKLLYTMFDKSLMFTTQGGDDGYDDMIILGKPGIDVDALGYCGTMPGSAVCTSKNYFINYDNFSYDKTTPPSPGKYNIYWKTRFANDKAVLIPNNYVKIMQNALIYFSKKK